MTRRRSAVPATVAFTALGLLGLSSCATFNRNDVAARVDGRSLTASAARALITLDDQVTTGDQLRQQLTTWVRVSALEAFGDAAQLRIRAAGANALRQGQPGLRAAQAKSIRREREPREQERSGQPGADGPGQPSLDDGGGVVEAWLDQVGAGLDQIDFGRNEFDHRP